MDSVRERVQLPDDPAATERLGEWFGRHLVRGDVVGLVGELGAGKTTFVRGLARGLAIDDPAAVSSPTYLLVVEHPGAVRLLHADAYLPDKLRAFLEDGGLDYLFDGDAVVVVEWAQRIADRMPARSIWLEMSLAPGGGRIVDVRAPGGAAFAWVAGARRAERAD
jgi:tRNA threonylcarbamoyladenosine biosynthesis protein TsaE